MARDVRFVSQKETYIVLNQYHEHRWKSTKIKYTCQAGKILVEKFLELYSNRTHPMLVLAWPKLVHIFEKRGLIFCCKGIGSYRNFNPFRTCKSNYACLSVFHNRLRKCLHGYSSHIIIFTNYAVLCSRYNCASSRQLWTSKPLMHWIPLAIYRVLNDFNFVMDDQVYQYITVLCGPGSSVGIATVYGLEGPGSNAGGDEIFRPSSPALGSTQPPVKWVPDLSRG